MEKFQSVGSVSETAPRKINESSFKNADLISDVMLVINKQLSKSEAVAALFSKLKRMYYNTCYRSLRRFFGKSTRTTVEENVDSLILSAIWDTLERQFNSTNKSPQGFLKFYKLRLWHECKIFSKNNVPGFVLKFTSDKNGNGGYLKKNPAKFVEFEKAYSLGISSSAEELINDTALAHEIINNPIITDDQRKLLVRYYIDGLTIQQVANEYKCSFQNIQQRLKKIIDKIKKEYKDKI